MPSTPGSYADYNDSNVIIQTGGNSFYVATDAILFDGVTAQFQLMKLAYGPTGAASIVSSTNGLPVSVISGGITANLIGFCGYIQGIASGYPVAVNGTVYTTGISSSPVYVRTNSGYQVEVTGGRNLSKSSDSVSVYGPNGITWVYANIVNTSGSALGVSSNPMFVQISGATINATINPTVGVTNTSANPLFVCGVSGGTAISVNVSNTVTISDTAILSGMTGIYGQVVTLNSNLSTLGLANPSTFKTGRVSSTYPSPQQMDSTGFTCSSNIKVKALTTNTDFVYLGNTSASSSLISSGYALDPGDEATLTLVNTNKIYLVSASGTQTITYMAS
jgi:hypothetical protein